MIFPFIHSVQLSNPYMPFFALRTLGPAEDFQNQNRKGQTSGLVSEAVPLISVGSWHPRGT